MRTNLSPLTASKKAGYLIISEIPGNMSYSLFLFKNLYGFELCYALTA